MVKIRTYDNIGDHVTVLYDKMFPLYIIRGDKNFLVDSGVTARAGDFHARIGTALDEIKPVGGNNVHTLLLTHTHWDHAGAAYELQKIYGYGVLTSVHGAGLLEKPKVRGFIDRLNQDYKKMIDDTSDTRFDRLEKVGMVREGDKIPVTDDADSYLEVIETPGHTRCSVSYLLHPERILFPGDASGVLEQNGGVKPLFLSSFKNYENSILKLLEKGAEILCMPHNRVVRGGEHVRAHLEASLARTRQLRDIIGELLKKEESIAKIAETIYLQEFPKPTLLGPKEALMINLEAMTKVIRREFPTPE